MASSSSSLRPESLLATTGATSPFPTSQLTASASQSKSTSPIAASPIEAGSNAAAAPNASIGTGKMPIGTGLSPIPNGISGLRTTSPNHDFGGRLYSKRTREIQAQEGIASNPWGPPTSGHSTPLRETIPESPGTGTFPDLISGSSAEDNASSSSGTRGRARAGTLPSRFSPAGLSVLNPPPVGLVPKTARPTPSTSPFKPSSTTPSDAFGFGLPNPLGVKATHLSRFRAGSMPQRANHLPNANPFGSSLFSSSWANRDRTNTLASIRSSNDPTSPAHSSFSRESLADADVKTLDYLGLVDTPKPSLANLATADISSLLTQQAQVGLTPQTIADLAALTKQANRFRSYSVNAKEKYADDDDEMGSVGYNYSGTMTPDGTMAALSLQEMIRQHNMEVQAFENFKASQTRPRARTAGVLDAPSSRLLRNYMPTASRLDNGMTADFAEESEYLGLADAVSQMNLKGSGLMPQEAGDDSPTRSLWIGNIPPSTTVSSLTVIFSPFGAIESARVLTHKSCGFVNFETLDSAVSARSHLNGKEIFPGAGPVRIGYGKVPSATGTPGANGVLPSPSPDPLVKGATQAAEIADFNTTAEPPVITKTLDLVEIKDEILTIVQELGATEEDVQRISANVDVAIGHNHYEVEVPPIPEPSHNRIHDAPRLREIRKRIDNNACTPQEIEDIALNMLDEIAELASDYLGNTVVQKLFEYCSEDVKLAMLERIAPHLPEIGIHKNGTWAAQKIIDVAKSNVLMGMIVESLRSYSMALFLDQFGNYVMQGCLRYQYPLNNFIFEVMLGRLWELAQGRFGARAMRACLESHYATKDQQRMIAATIALHSVQLATNANGALLLTWFLDTCTFPRRRTVLAPRLVPHLVRLCTHKVAYLTVLKIINQRNEPEARDTILQALFFSPNDKVLEDILTDQQCGSTLIFKVLTTPFFDEKIRADVCQNVRNVLVRIKAQPQQGYKRLMDEVGLSTRGNGPARDLHTPRDEQRPSSKHSSSNGNMGQSMSAATMGMDGSPISRPFYPNVAPPPWDMSAMPGLQRTSSMGSSGFDGSNNVGYTPTISAAAPAFAPTSNPGMVPPMTPHGFGGHPQHAGYYGQQQHQAAQNQHMMAAAAAANRVPTNGGFFSQVTPVGPPGMNGTGYPTPNSSNLDAYRQAAALASYAGTPPPGFGAVNGMNPNALGQGMGGMGVGMLGMSPGMGGMGNMGMFGAYGGGMSGMAGSGMHAGGMGGPGAFMSGSPVSSGTSHGGPIGLGGGNGRGRRVG